MDDDDAIVIIGVGCKYPGADNLEEFWKVLVNGENHVKEIPKERWNLEAFYSADPDQKGKTYVRRAGLLRNHDVWDNKLFGISDIEAEKIDPQQRYVLECVHMALEDGGITRKEINGSDTGVYIGFMNDDYRNAAGDGLDTFNNYTLTGTSPSIIAARVSFIYNLLGPSMSLDTACSSALVAVDVGVQALKTGRCKTVIAGGVNSILYPDMFIGLTRARMVSPTGQSQAFSDKADGYARGEGCGIVILTTMKQALKEGRKIWAVISTGCNQDGHTTSPITAPSGQQQRRLLEKVYAENNINPGLVSVIEAHGTGTPVGDPIEANTLGNFFGKNKTEGPPIFIGSVKTNIGHTESAAGTAGLIKILLMMEHETIVPSLLLETINPKIHFEHFNFEVPRKLLTWGKPSTGQRVACVNSFGFGGTNSHVIVKEYIKTRQSKFKNSESTSNIVLLSSIDQSGLIKNIKHFLFDLQIGSYTIEDISYTSMCKRDHFQCRRGLVAKSCEDLRVKCKQILESLERDKQKIYKPPNIIAVFCGVGTAWLGMCNELLKTEHIFRQTVEEIDTLFKQYISLSMKDIFENKKSVDDPFTGHIAIFTCQVGLWSLWKYWGLPVDYVVGQSVGEVAAAYASGSLTLETAVRVIYHRSLALSNTKGGCMFVVSNCSTEIVANICEEYPNKACIAVYSSPKSCTVSCDKNAVDEIKRKINNSRDDNSPVFRDLKVKVAYHSFYTESAGIQVENSLRGIYSKDTNIPMISTVTGKPVQPKTPMNEEYWKLNVQKPVLFKQAITAAAQKTKYNIYLEVGPRPVLHVHLPDNFKAEEACCLPSIKPKNEMTTIVSSVIELYEKGLNLEWKKLCQATGSMVKIPRYTFNGYKRLFEPETRILKSQGLVNPGLSSHLFVHSSDMTGRTFTINLDPATTPFAFEHFVSGANIVPGALYAEVGLEIGKSILRNRPQDLEVSVYFIRPFSLLSDTATVATVSVDKNEGNENGYNGKITTGNSLTSTFTVKPKTCNNFPSNININEIRQRCKDFQNSTETYNKLTKLGFSYGDCLQVLGDVWKNNRECLVEIKSAHIKWSEITSTHFHPILLDGLIQILGIFASDDIGKTIIPYCIENVILNGVFESSMLGYGQVVSNDERFLTYNMCLLGRDGFVIAEVHNCKIKIVGEEPNLHNDLAYELVLQPADVEETQNDTHNDSNRINLLTFDNFTRDEAKRVFNVEYLKSELINNRSLEDLKLLFKGIAKNESSIICIFPGKCLNNNSSGKHVLRTVQMSCMTILAYLQTIDEVNTQIPLYVFTQNTQGTQSDNFFGSEVWGQVRCALWEKPLPILLIDLQTSLQDAKSFINDLVLGKIMVQNTSELIFTNGKILTNNFQVLQDFKIDSKLRLATFDAKCDIDIRSSHSVDIERPFGIVKPERQHRLKNTVLIKVDMACIHHKGICQRIIDDLENDFNLSTNDNETGYKILTFEMTGTEIPDESQGRETARESRNIIACYPTKLSTVVSIPHCCVLDKNELPWYQPGLVLTSVILLTIVNHIEEKSNVIVLYDDSNSLQARLMESLLVYMKKSRVELRRELDFELQSDDNVTFVPLLWVNVNCLNFIEKHKNMNMVTLSCFVNASFIQWLSFRMDESKMNIVETTQATAKRNFYAAVPKVFKWLRQNLSNVPFENTKYDPVNLLSIPTKTMSLPYSSISNIQIKASRDSPFRKNGCYVVVGGLTGLGWVIVNLLAEMNAGIVVTFSRRPPSTDKLKELNELSHTTGCKIFTFSTDITDMKSLQNTLQQLTQLTDLPIKGIFQGAGVLNDSLFVKMNNSHFGTVLTPKVLGTWNLHQVSKEFPLDYFVMHSSVASVFGNLGQSNYGAANAFMDSLAHYRRSKGLCGQSINWGPLSVGMGSNDDTVQTNLKTFGFLPLDVSDIRSCLLNCLNSSKSQITIGSFDWNRIESNIEGNITANRFKLLFNPNGYRDVEVSKKHLGHVELASFESGKERLEFVENLVLQAAYNAFAVDIDNLSNDTILSDLGIDSMQAMTFVNMIHEHTNIRLPFVVLLTAQTTLETIIQLLDQKMSSKVQSKPNSKQVIDNSVLLSMTPLEKYRHDIFLSNPKDPLLFMVLDLEVPLNLANQANWISALKMVHRKHSGLRTLFKPSNDNIRYGFKRTILDGRDIEIDFQVVQMSELHASADEILNDLDKYLFDPSVNIPMRTLFALSSDRCVVRFIFSLLCLDLSSMFIVLNDLRTNYEQQSTTDYKDDGLEEDLAVVFETRIQHEMQSLKSYWKFALQQLLQVETLTLSSDKTLNIRDEKLIFKEIDIPIETFSNVEAYLKEEGLKLFDFIATIYEVLLYTQLRVPALCIEAIVDLRVHFPEIRDRVCRFTNWIPLVATFEDTKISLKQFLQANAKTVLKAIDKSLLPNEDIWKLVPGLDETQFRRHFLIMEDISLLSQLEIDNTEVHLKNIFAIKTFFETALLVRPDKVNKVVKFEFGFNPLVITDQHAKDLVGNMLELIQTMIREPNKRVLDLGKHNIPKHNAISEQIVNLSEVNGSFTLDNSDIPKPNCDQQGRHLNKENVIKTGIFMKQTSRGWDHEVCLSTKSDSNGSYNLLWVSSKRKTAKSLMFSQIKRTDLMEMNGHFCLIIYTVKRKYTFKTRKRQTAIEWMDHLTNGLHTHI